MSRKTVGDVLSPDMTREIWTGNYETVLPISVQGFDLSAVLPAVFYMFRFGHRRGKGKFLETFAGRTGTPRERRRVATVDRIADVLADDTRLSGFQGQAEHAILGDLLLCYCVENAGRALGRQEQVQRVAPAHYMASWLDLPDSVAHLRKVPEMVVAMLADQEGEHVVPNAESDRTWFPVGRRFDANVLITAFNSGMEVRGELSSSRTSDKFSERASVGVDEILMIRLAQRLGEAPDKLRGGEGERISNQRPIAQQSARHFSEDIRRFVRSYAGLIPRQSFLVMLESCMAVGLTTILNSVVEVMLEWADTGTIQTPSTQRPMPLFVDASNGTDRRLRALSEQCFDDFLRRMDRFPVVLMAARLLDWGARYVPRTKMLQGRTRPYATDWLNLLGAIMHSRHEESRRVLDRIDEDTQKLSEKLRGEESDVADLLGNATGHPNPVWRLAESLTLLQGRGNIQDNLLKCIDSALLVERPNGLANKRRIVHADVVSGKKTRDVRSLVFTDAVLDYLVHLHLLPSGHHEGRRTLSLREFLRIIRERYGFCVDHAPPDMSVSSEILQTNRAIFERRLRDLGLLVGVNDAEAMKRLVPRFSPRKEETNAVE